MEQVDGDRIALAYSRPMSSEAPNVGRPLIADRVDPWETHEGKTFRYFQSTPRGEAAQVRIGGFQYADGTFADVVIHVDADGDGLDLAGSQELITNLIAAQTDVQRITT